MTFGAEMKGAPGVAEVPHLICTLHSALYAVEADRVLEIFSLPELTPVEELPDYIAGVVNVRDTIAPVVDLHRRFGRPPEPYHLDDVVVLLSVGDRQLLGIIVNEVQDVQFISPAAVEAAPPLSPNGRHAPRFVTRLAKVGDDIVMVLDHARLTSDAENDAAMLAAEADAGATNPPALHAGNGAAGNHSPPPAPAPRAPQEFWPDAPAATRAVLRARARHLAPSAEDKDVGNRVPLAAIKLGGEYFGIDLDLIQEFSNPRKITPVPCCPPHIVGQINLRGNIVTLVDIAPVLHLASAPDSTATKVMVVQIDSQRVGVPVDDVADVFSLQRDDIADVPATAKAGGSEFLKGAAAYGGQMLSLLDLRSVLTKGGLLVNETV